MKASSQDVIRPFVAAAAVLMGSVANGDDDEVKRLQGRFERTFTNPAGTVFRTVKEVEGAQSTVTTYDDVGNVIEAHASTFKTEKRGPVRVFTFSNVVVTAGPAKGHIEPGPRSYIYRFEGETFAEAWGFLDGDNSAPRMIYWRKIKGN
jgi:hypothetical protein